MKQESKQYKIIIDTNIWISFLIGKNLKGLQHYIFSSTFQIVTCKEQIFELMNVLRRPKMEKFFSEKQIDDFFDLLDESACLTDIHTTVDICRDPKDNYLLALAIDANADYLISGDYDLLSLKQIKETIITSFSDFEHDFLRS